MIKYQHMGEAVTAAMQKGIDLVFDGKCLATVGTDICILEPGHTDPHKAWGSDRRWSDAEEPESKR